MIKLGTVSAQTKSPKVLGKTEPVSPFEPFSI